MNDQKMQDYIVNEPFKVEIDEEKVKDCRGSVPPHKALLCLANNNHDLELVVNEKKIVTIRLSSIIALPLFGDKHGQTVGMLLATPNKVFTVYLLGCQSYAKQLLGDYIEPVIHELRTMPN
jgi:hypothetical protein